MISELGAQSQDINNGSTGSSFSFVNNARRHTGYSKTEKESSEAMPHVQAYSSSGLYFRSSEFYSALPKLSSNLDLNQKANINVFGGQKRNENDDSLELALPEFNSTSAWQSAPNERLAPAYLEPIKDVFCKSKQPSYTNNAEIPEVNSFERIASIPAITESNPWE